MTIDDVIDQIQARLGLEADTEHELLEEIRSHLEDAVAEARARGADESQALDEAAAAFGVEQAASELRATYAGRGTADGVAAVALPVLFALILRWLIFAPDGSADAWRVTLTPTAFAIIGAVAIVIPLLRFPHRRYAIALWIFFWSLSLLTAIWPTLRW